MCAVLKTEAYIWSSPCPSVFQYGFDEGVPVGILDAEIPESSAEKFKISFELLPKAEKYKDPAKLPKVQMEFESQPSRVVHDVLHGEKIRYLMRFDTPGSVFKYKVMRIMVNCETVCEDPDGKCTERCRHSSKFYTSKCSANIYSF